MHEMVKTLLKDRAFVVSSVVLLIAAMTLQTATRLMGVYFRKLPVPLRKSLDEFDVSKLLPTYKLYARPPRLPAESEEALGTDQYLQCLFEDTTLDENAPGKYINFFVTYYTGSLDQVPHVPEECYVGGGKTKAGQREVDLTIPGIGLENDTLRVSQVIFSDPRSAAQDDIPVIYFFSVNTAFKWDRMGARLSLGNLRLKRSYFSKVELAFAGQNQPSRDQALTLTTKFLSKALPILMHEHWPTWDQVARKD